MNDSSGFAKVLLALLVLIGGISIIILFTRSQNAQAGIEGAQPTPLLHGQYLPGRETAVPGLKPASQVESPALKGVPVIDLSPELPLKDKFDIYVQHADGSVNQFLVGLSPSGAEVFSLDPSELPKEVLKGLSLSGTDQILFWQPPSLYRSAP
jgi:hypothetical protein